MLARRKGRISHAERVKNYHDRATTDGVAEVNQVVMFVNRDVLPYKPVLTATENLKGVLDVDTVKGCFSGMAAYPGTGCYGACGFEYVASEIRQNQCDANNKICGEFPNVKWVQGSSAEYMPEHPADLVFTCPPYYKVEKYVDYDGSPPPGEINSLSTYDEFLAVLFAGYQKAIESLKDNRFFVVMTGDSRDKSGAYYCHEADTELFFKRNGLSVYNRIVYLEAEFTRLAHAKKTLHVRKFPKREQKIIVAYKGKIGDIGQHFAPIGRL